MENYYDLDFFFTNLYILPYTKYVVIYFFLKKKKNSSAAMHQVSSGRVSLVSSLIFFLLNFS
jgi:hypothetical protein